MRELGRRAWNEFHCDDAI